MSAAPVAVMDAHCPLCGAPILLVGRSGRVLAEDFHAVPLHKHGRGEGFLVCDDCALLAELPADTTLN